MVVTDQTEELNMTWSWFEIKVDTDVCTVTFTYIICGIFESYKVK